MHPELIRIGSFPIRSFGVMMVIAFFTAIWLATRRAQRFGLDGSKIQDASLLIIFAGVFGARLAYIVQNISYFKTHQSELYSLRFEGLTSFGGLIAGGLALYLYARKQKLSVFSFMDTCAVPVLVAHAIGRIGCFLNGCCYGHACPTSPPGVHFEGRTGFFLPAQLYDSAMVMVGVGLLALFERSPRKPGNSIGMAFVIYGASRFIYEYWREGVTAELIKGTPFTLGQVFSLATVLLGLVFMLSSRRQLNMVAEEPSLIQE